MHVVAHERVVGAPQTLNRLIEAVCQISIPAQVAANVFGLAQTFAQFGAELAAVIPLWRAAAPVGAIALPVGRLLVAAALSIGLLPLLSLLSLLSLLLSLLSLLSLLLSLLLALLSLLSLLLSLLSLLSLLGACLLSLVSLVSLRSPLAFLTILSFILVLCYLLTILLPLLCLLSLLPLLISVGLIALLLLIAALVAIAQLLAHRFNGVGELTRSVQGVLGLSARAFTLRVLFGFGQLLLELSEVLLDHLIALSRAVELVHFHKPPRGADAILHAVLAQAVGGIAQFVGGCLLIVAEGARVLL